MERQKFLAELLNNEMAIDARELAYLKRLVINKIPISFKELPTPKLAFFDAGFNSMPEQPKQNDQAVAVIRISGTINKSARWFSYSSEDYIDLIEQAYQMDDVKAIVLQLDTGGGAVDAMLPFENILKRKNKPVFAAVERGLSAGYFIASFTDRIFAQHKMNEVGSIGVMAIIQDDSKWEEEMGWKTRYIVPPESNFKNLPHIKALEGDDSLIIKEELSPMARFFQETVKANRPALKLETEGIISGKIFYAHEAVNNGLIDEIAPMEDIINYAYNYDVRNNLKEIF